MGRAFVLQLGIVVSLTPEAVVGVLTNNLSYYQLSHSNV